MNAIFALSLPHTEDICTVPKGDDCDLELRTLETLCSIYVEQAIACHYIGGSCCIVYSDIEPLPQMSVLYSTYHGKSHDIYLWHLLDKCKSLQVYHS